MSSKTVWIAGGLVLALGAVAYLSYNESPAGKDAAGTIVQAKRALSDASGGSGGSQIANNGAAADSRDVGDARNALDAGNGKLDAGNGKLDAGNGKLDAGNGKLDAGNGKLDSKTDAKPQ